MVVLAGGLNADMQARLSGRQVFSEAMILTAPNFLHLQNLIISKIKPDYIETYLKLYENSPLNNSIIFE